METNLNDDKVANLIQTDQANSLQYDSVENNCRKMSSEVVIQTENDESFKDFTTSVITTDSLDLQITSKLNTSNNHKNLTRFPKIKNKEDNFNSTNAFENSIKSKYKPNSFLLSPSSSSNMTFHDDAENPNKIANKLLGHREELMQLFMVKRQNDYTTKESFTIFVGTWNVNGQYPPSSVKKWLAEDPHPPDIYAIGFQELDLSKEAFVFTESSREEEWVKIITKSLHPKAEYCRVKLIRLVGMMLLVYVAKQHARFVNNVASHYVGTGLLGRMGNKGAVGVRFNLHNSTFCFVNSHLAAHADLMQRRNEDFAEIRSRMRFADSENPGHRSIFQHDFLIWFGDLNYRIDGLKPDHVKDLIEKSHYKLLKENDQLTCQRREGNVFVDFHEGDINFRPTYKYNPGSDHWDSSEKCRTPAWCDRILWRETILNSSKQDEKPPTSIHQKNYRSHPALKISDHKPVSSLFSADVKVVNREEYRRVYEEEIRRLDRMENDWLPTMSLSSHSIDFGDVKFQSPICRTLLLHNTGQVPCHYEFIGKFEEKAFCKPWLTISKHKGFVMPDEKIDIEFEVYVNKSTVLRLNTGEEKIEDILILHLIGGKDFFITLNGRYFPSFFGMPLEVLCQLNRPIRQVPQSEILKLSQTSKNTLVNPLPLKVPKELWRIMDHLNRSALKQEDLFQEPGLHKELQEIQENLDSTYPSIDEANMLPGSNHSVVESLLVFLESLPEPVIPYEYYPLCLKVYNDFEKSKTAMSSVDSFYDRLQKNQGRPDESNDKMPRNFLRIFWLILLPIKPA